MGAIAPTAKKLWGDAFKSPPQEFCYVSFETVKCTLKIRIYHYASDKSCADFSLKCTKSVWRQPGPTGGAYSTPPDLAGFRSWSRDKERRKGEKTGGDRQLREGTEEGGKGREGRRRGIEWEKNGSRNLAGASKGTIRHRNPRGTIFLAGSGSNVSVIGDGLYHIHRPTCFLPKDGLGEVF